MLGKNHAVYAAAAWLGGYPLVAEYSGIENAADIPTIAVTTLIAAGAGVVPDLDHPDARPSTHFGILSRILAKGINSASGGHRHGTHSILCAAVLGAIAYATQYSPEGVGRWAAVVTCGFCASVGLALVGPSLGFNRTKSSSLLVGAGVGWWTYTYFTSVAPALWILAAGGVLVHIACDGVTKGGVPVFWPFTKKRFALGLFRVGGPGETIATVIGMSALAVATWNVAVYTA